jgi:hypothetical protein
MVLRGRLCAGALLSYSLASTSLGSCDGLAAEYATQRVTQTSGVEAASGCSRVMQAAVRVRQGKAWVLERGRRARAVKCVN